jgi:beta-lactamase superfamily II metal-dependent hydrolase
MGSPSPRTVGAVTLLGLALPGQPACSADCPDPSDAAPSDAALTWLQIGLSGRGLGESALVLGTDGTSLLFDSGGNVHADEVLAAVEDWTGEAAVDWVVVTHAHLDHLGGIVALLAAEPPALAVRRGIVHRGFVDLDARAADLSLAKEFCGIAADDRAGAPLLALCSAPGAMPCDASAGNAPWAADACPGLLAGDLAAAADDAAIEGGAGAAPGRAGHELAAADPPRAAFILLGDARLVFVAADGFVADVDAGPGATADLRAEAGVRYDEGNHENALSVVAALQYGDFDLLEPGDLVGGLDGTPDMEGPVAARAAALRDPDGAPLLPAGVDVLKLGHHGVNTSGSSPWFDWLLPDDGVPRHALVGATDAYAAAPHDDVLDAVLPRLNGGSVWVTETGAFAGRDDGMRVAHGDVVVRVAEGGGSYHIGMGEGGEDCGLAELAR